MEAATPRADAVPAAADVQQQIESSVLRTAELFALTKRRDAWAHDYAPRYEAPDRLLETHSAVGRVH